jgi:hypothetical protein
MSKLLLPLFEHSPLLILPIIAMLIFMATFLLVTLRAMKQSKSEHEAMARIPLDDTKDRRP